MPGILPYEDPEYGERPTYPAPPPPADFEYAPAHDSHVSKSERRQRQREQEQQDPDQQLGPQLRQQEDEIMTDVYAGMGTSENEDGGAPVVLEED